MATLGAGRTLAADTQAPDVVASIPPIHSLVAQVMDGVGEPHLLVKGGQSPHTYAMRPMDAKALESADLVIWVGPEVEGFLTKPLDVLARNADVLTLIDSPGMMLLPIREGGDWDEHDHDHGEHDHGHDHHVHDHGSHDHGEDAIDGHIWLSPENAATIIDQIADNLIALDPAHQALYTSNAADAKAQLETLTASLSDELTPVEDKPFIVFHDGYHYFEQAFGLKAVGSVTVDPHVPTGGKHLAELREKIEELGAVCVFAEPQFEPKIIQALIDGTPARSGTLDPLGADLETGPALYEKMMTRMGNAFATCLSETS